MTASTRMNVARSDVVGSLLRPTSLREARQGVREGRASEAELHTAEDRAAFETGGHDMAAELVADAEIDNTVFEGINGLTRHTHLPRQCPRWPLAGQRRL